MSQATNVDTVRDSSMRWLGCGYRRERRSVPLLLGFQRWSDG